MTPEELDTRINLLPRVKHDGLDYINLTAVLLLLRAGKPRAPAVMTPATLTRYWVTLSDQPEERTQVIRAADVDMIISAKDAEIARLKAVIERAAVVK